MYRNLKPVQPEQTIEGAILQKYEFKGEIVCITFINPHTKKQGIAPGLNQPFREVISISELLAITLLIDESLN